MRRDFDVVTGDCLLINSLLLLNILTTDYSKEKLLSEFCTLWSLRSFCCFCKANMNTADKYVQLNWLISPGTECFVTVEAKSVFYNYELFISAIQKNTKHLLVAALETFEPFIC